MKILLYYHYLLQTKRRYVVKKKKKKKRSEKIKKNHLILLSFKLCIDEHEKKYKHVGVFHNIFNTFIRNTNGMEWYEHNVPVNDICHSSSALTLLFSSFASQMSCGRFVFASIQFSILHLQV